METVDYIRFSKTHPATIPPTGYIDLFYDMSTSSPVLMGNDGVKTPVGSGGTATPPVWGAITGNLVDQADLAEALDGKLSTLGGTVTGNLTVSLILQTMGLLVSDSVLFAALNFEYNDGPTGASAAAHRAALGVPEPVVGIRSHGTSDDTIGIADRYVRSTGAADVTQRVPNDAAIDFPIGTRITFRQAGTGTITLVPGAGVTLHGQDTTAGRNRSLGIIKVGSNEWDTERGAF